MNAYQQERWQRLVDQAQRDLEEEEYCDALAVDSIESLMSSVHGAVAATQRQVVVRLLEQLRPTLKHVETFTWAISSATQAHPYACLIWGGIQAVILSACSLPSVLEQSFNLMGDLNNTLGRFTTDLALYSDREELQWSLQDLYEDYLYCCTATIRYLRHPIRSNLISFIWNSKPQQILKKTKDDMKKHIKQFEKEVDSIHRQDVRKQTQSQLRSLSIETSSPRSAETEVPPMPGNKTATTVSMFRNWDFTGRDKELETIHEKFAAARKPTSPSTNPRNNLDGPVCCVLHGLGGSGKTHTALEYYYRYRDEYDTVFWCPSERDPDLAASFVQIALVLGLVNDDTTDMVSGKANQSKAVQEVRDWLRTTEQRWLLVFDNVEDHKDLEPYLPTTTQSPGCVIITTQRPQLPQITKNFYNMELESLSEEPGAALLLQYLGREAADEKEKVLVQQISVIVGGLPLALATIGGYISESGCSIEEFYTLMERSSNAWRDSQDTRLESFDKTLGTVFEIALKELPTNARNLINILAFLNPDSIPENILLTTDPDEDLQFLKNKADLIELTRILRRRQLVRRETSGNTEPFLSIHRSLQWCILLDLSSDKDLRWKIYYQAFILLRRGLPMSAKTLTPEPEKWPRFERYAPQVLALRTHCLWPEPAVNLPVNFAKLLADLGTYMWHAGLVSDGTEALQTAEHILDKREVDPIDSLRADIVANLAVISGFSGISYREKNMERRREHLKIRKEKYREIPKYDVSQTDLIRYYNSESDMAFGYLQEEKFDKVRDIMENCYEQYTSWGGIDEIPYEYAKYWYLMAFVEASRGDIARAIELSHKGVNAVTKSAGADNPLTLLWKFALANLLFHQGNVSESLQLNEEILSKRQRVCSEFNAFTLESYSTCGALRFKEGDLEKSATYLKCCLERRRRAYWDREGVARARLRYSYTLKGLGKIKEAADELAMARAVRDQILQECDGYFVDPDPQSEEAAFDMMCAMWSGRFTGGIAQIAP